MILEGAAAKYSIILGRERGSWVEFASLVEMLSYGKAAYLGVYRTFLLLETNTKVSFGEEEVLDMRVERDSSCERKHFPTPPAPVYITVRCEGWQGGVE